MSGKSIKAISISGLAVISGGLTMLGVAFLLTLLLSPVLLSYSNHFYGLTYYQEFQEYWRIIHYFASWQPWLTFKWLPLAVAGQRHFAEVRGLIWWGGVITLIAGIVFAWTLKWLKVNYQLWRLVPGLQFLLWLWMAGLIFGVMNFDNWFITFHRVIFHNQDWIFTTKKEPIIRLLTTGFFLRYLICWVLINLGLVKLTQSLINRWLVSLLAKPRLDPANNCRNQGNNDNCKDD